LKTANVYTLLVLISIFFLLLVHTFLGFAQIFFGNAPSGCLPFSKEFYANSKRVSTIRKKVIALVIVFSLRIVWKFPGWPGLVDASQSPTDTSRSPISSVRRPIAAREALDVIRWRVVKLFFLW
jgi:hypothetical protein